MRPRLGSEVRARRHRVGDDVFVMLHHGDEVMRLGEREWAVLQTMDGTRDAAGVVLAARLQGVVVSEEHVRAFAAQLAAAGLLESAEWNEDGLEVAPAPVRPVRALPGARFRCDGSGACCRSFPTILFTPLEAARARVTLPRVEGAGEFADLAFLPEHGLDDRVFAVAQADGACVYHDGSGCGLHAAAGALAKPKGCQIFPLGYVDTGTEIRVAPTPVCRCAFDSLRADDAEPLSEVTDGSELDEAIYVPTLPERGNLGRREVSREELVDFCDGLIERIDDDPALDLAELCWSTATEVGGEALDLQDRWSRLRDRVETHRTRNRWRAPTDRHRNALDWVARALQGSPRSPPPADPTEERFYLRSVLFLCAPAEEAVEDLRRRALRLWIARALPDELPAHGLAMVEALGRGHGVV